MAHFLRPNSNSHTGNRCSNGGAWPATLLYFGLLVMNNIKRRGSSGLQVPWFLGLVLCIGSVSGEAWASFTDVSSTVLPMPVMGNGLPPVLDGGATTGDFDSDGDTDIMIPTREDRDLYFRNNGDGTFTETGEQVGFTLVTDGRSAAAGDIDNDGDLDIYVAAHFETGHYLYINDGSGSFTEEAALRGAAINVSLRHGRAVAFGDYDRDGYLDIFVAEWSEPRVPMGNTGPVSRLLRNRGALQPGYFEDVTITAGVVQNSIAGRRAGVFPHTPRFTDLDRDGWPDLVLASDFSESRLYWNNGDGTFTDGTVASGYGTGNTDMGMDTVDIDGDGLLDIVTTAIFFDGNGDGIADNHLDGNRLYLNNGDRTFTDVTDTAGIRNGYWGWGVVAFDFDNDADLDLFQANGFFEVDCPPCQGELPDGTDWNALYGNDPTLLFENLGNTTFAEVAAAYGIVNTEYSLGVIAFDYDDDGDLDLLQVNRDTSPNLYRNDTASDNDWLQVKLESTGSAPDGVGAYVTVTPTGGGPSQTRELTGSGTWMTQDGSGILHFGFGDLPDGSTADVFIEWPSGSLSVLPAQALNRRVTYAESLPTALSLVADKASPGGVQDLGEVTFTALAAGGTGQFEYQFWVRAPGEDWVLARDYDTANTFASTLTPVGEFTIRARARNAGSSAAYELEQTLAFIVIPDAPVSSLALALDKPDAMYAGTGDTATVTATAGSHAGNPQYKFWLSEPGGSLVVVQDWSASDTYEVTAAAVGPYSVVARTRNTGSPLEFEAEAAVAFDALEPALAVSLSADKPSPALLGDVGEVTFTAQASGGTGNYEYAFIAIYSDGSFAVVQGYSPSPTYRTTPAEADFFTLWVWARNAGRPVWLEAFNATGFNVLGEPGANQVFVTADRKHPSELQSIGTVTFTALRGGPQAGMEYQFWLRTDGGTAQLVQDYGAANTYSIAPSTAGVLEVTAYARDSGSAEPTEVQASRTLEVLAYPAVAATSLDRANTGSIVLQEGGTASFKAKAIGSSGNYEYKFQIRTNGSIVYEQAYSPSDLIEWLPTAAGNYSIAVFARNAGSATVFDALGGTTFDVLDLPAITALDLTADQQSPAPYEGLGTVTFTATATGGSANIEYQFHTLTPGVGWAVAQAYSPANSFAYASAVPGANGIVVLARNVGSNAVSDINDLLVFTVNEPLQPQGLLVVDGGGDGAYIAGTEVTITADPSEPHYYFSHWSGDATGALDDANAAQATLVMPDAPTILTANYLPGVPIDADVGVARRWNEVLMQAIRKDFARPTIHARNLFHIAAGMYDAWAAFAEVEQTWLLGRSRAGTDCPLAALPVPADTEAARREAISHVAYRLLLHRFLGSPGVLNTNRDANALMAYLGYDGANASTDYSSGSAAALGNYIAQCYINFGLADAANESNEYRNISYQPVNAALQPELPGNPNISDLNRWQPLSLVQFIDQGGNPVSGSPAFLSPEWGQVVPFALQATDRTDYQRDGFDYWVYHDPGSPPKIDGTLTDIYKWAFSLVSIWSSHLDPTDGVMMDISPASIGNIQSYPTQFDNYPQFYNTLLGGDPGVGYTVNPVTGQPYAPQIVARGDYARVLAEFWADGPESETPPGHWFVILNEVNDHPLSTRRFAGAGPELGNLEWEIKSYFTLGGAMHDSAVAAWGVKGWYDYIRPVSSLRAMADLGQSSDPGLPSYHMDGIPLEPGYIELVEAGDPLAGDASEHVGKIKVLAWRGPDYIADPATEDAGVGWILAENWWPYQRPSFVTPPFAGYVSGHSTFSRAAAEVMTALTGDAYFPGGMSGFEVSMNEFLVFEEGPSVDMTLQWATYRDASDQCSLSRIWGGIHPPIDDIPGRLMGIEIGVDAFDLAADMFNGVAPP